MKSDTNDNLFVQCARLHSLALARCCKMDNYTNFQSENLKFYINSKDFYSMNKTKSEFSNIKYWYYSPLCHCLVYTKMFCFNFSISYT